MTSITFNFLPVPVLACVLCGAVRESTPMAGLKNRRPNSLGGKNHLSAQNPLREVGSKSTADTTGSVRNWKRVRVAPELQVRALSPRQFSNESGGVGCRNAGGNVTIADRGRDGTNYSITDVTRDPCRSSARPALTLCLVEVTSITTQSAARVVARELRSPEKLSSGVAPVKQPTPTEASA